MHNVSAKYSLSETYCQLGNFEEGLKTLHLIPAMYKLTEYEQIEHDNYVSLFTFKNKIRENGRSIAQLDKEEINQMLYFAEASHGLSSVMARGILCFFYEICIEDEEGEGTKEKGGGSKENGEKENGEKEKIDLRKSASSVDKKLENITIHPNPTTGELTVVGYQFSVQGVEVFDVYGRKLLTFSVPLTPINIAHLQAGIYFVKITTEQGEVIKKVVKQ